MRPPAETYQGTPCKRCGGTERYDGGACAPCRRSHANQVNARRRRDLIVSEVDWPDYVEAFNGGWQAAEDGQGAGACPYLSRRQGGQGSPLVRLSARKGRWWRLGWGARVAGRDQVGGDFPKLEPVEVVSDELVGSGG